MLRTAAVSLLLVVVTPLCLHADLVIDDFSTPQGPTSVAGSVTGSGILGGTREYFPFSGSLDVSGGVARIISTGSPSTGEDAFAFLIYGGLNGPLELNLDLSAPGLAFKIEVADLGTKTDFDTTLNLRIATTGVEASSSIAQPTITQAGTLVIPLSDFFQNDPNPADLSDIDRISFEFGSSAAVSGNPLTIRSFAVVPEPSAFLYGGLITTLAGVGYRVRRRVA